MIEEDKIRQVIDAIPLQWLLRCQALPHRGEHRRIGPHARMAGHARLGRRDAGKGGFLSRRVAVAAIQSQT